MKLDPVALAQEAVELAWTANAYLDGAIRLTEALLEDEGESSLHHFRAPLHLAYLGIELFLKSGLSFSGVRAPSTHDLGALREAYGAIDGLPPLPIPSYFEDINASNFDLFDRDAIARSQRLFERLRYHSDRAGLPFPRLEKADLKKLLEELVELHKPAVIFLLTVDRLSGRMVCARSASPDA